MRKTKMTIPRRGIVMQKKVWYIRAYSYIYLHRLRSTYGSVDDTLPTKVPAGPVNTLSILKENLIRKKAIHIF